MKKYLVPFLLFMIIVHISISCKKSDSDNGSGSRTVTYQLTGNYTGTMFASYTSSNGGTINEQVLALPWIKKIVYSDNVDAAVFAASGNGGTAGQQVNIKLKKGSNDLPGVAVVAGPDGSFTRSLPAIQF